MFCSSAEELLQTLLETGSRMLNKKFAWETTSNNQDTTTSYIYKNQDQM